MCLRVCATVKVHLYFYMYSETLTFVKRPSSYEEMASPDKCHVFIWGGLTRQVSPYIPNITG